MDKDSKKVGPFSDNPLMIGYDNRLFESDPALGHVFPENRIVDQKGLISLDEKIASIKESKGSFVVLNIGDSSTSGWNSDNVFYGCPDPYAALFSYKTYSDILQLKYSISSINAGVPGYTTYQAKKYLEILLKKFSAEKIAIDYVTLYLGNNDCTYNGLEDKTRIDSKIPSKGEILTRVSLEDFKNTYREMIKIIREYGAEPIILNSASNYKWQPGLRSKKYPEELQKQIIKLTDQKIKVLFSESEKEFEQQNFEASLEKDLLLPRIKEAYKKAVRNIGKETSALLIEVQDCIKDESDFVDYCHPGEAASERIADAVKACLKVKNTSNFQTPVPQDLPSDTYTLY